MKIYKYFSLRFCKYLLYEFSQILKESNCLTQKINLNYIFNWNKHSLFLSKEVKRVHIYEKEICSKSTKFYFISSPSNQEESIRKCMLLGMKLPLPRNDEENMELIELFRAQKYDCNDDITLSKMWLHAKKNLNLNNSSIVDENNNIVNYRPALYNLFDNSSKCVFMYAHGRDGWYDTSCEIKGCFVCASVKPPKLFTLRGLRSYVNDLDFKFTSIINENGKLSFKGFTSLYIYCKNGVGAGFDTWDLQDIWKNVTVAHIIRDCFDPPIGMHEWVNDKIKIQLSLSICKPGEFSCGDGSCIPINKRCNLLSDCLDNIDEENCTKILNLKDYISTLPPPSDVLNEPLKIELRVALMRLMDIDSVNGYITSYSSFFLNWYDKRITFKSLQKYFDLNLIEAYRIWKPQISIDNSLKAYHMEEQEKIRVRRLSEPMKDNLQEAIAGKNPMNLISNIFCTHN